LSIDPQELAKAELAKAMIPTPDDVCDSLSPIAALYYYEQLGWQLLTLWVAHVSDSIGADPEINAELSATLTAINMIVGETDAVCVNIGLLPPEAISPNVA